MEFSLTYQGVAVLLFGFILRAAGSELPHEDVADFVATGAAIVGAAMTLYGRWRIGDLTWLGIKK